MKTPSAKITTNVHKKTMAEYRMAASDGYINNFLDYVRRRGLVKFEIFQQ